MERSANGVAGSVVEGAGRGAGGPFAPDDPKPGETWRHYNGHDYEVVAVGLDEATRTPMVAYRCPESGKTRFRTLADFTEYVHAEGGTGRVYSRRRFVRVYRPGVDVPAASQHGEWPTGYPPGSIAEQRCREEMEQGFESMGAALDEIRAICRAEGIDFGTTVDSVRMLATRARLYIEMTDRVNRGRDDSQPGKPPGTVTRSEFDEAVRSGIENGAPMGDPTIDDDDDSQDGNPDPLESMYDAWIALQLVIARLETVACYHSAPDPVLRAILAGCDDVKAHLDAAMGEAEDAAGIEPGGPD